MYRRNVCGVRFQLTSGQWEEYRLPFDSEITKVKQLGLKLLSVSIEKVKNMDYTEDSKGITHLVNKSV